MNYMQKAVLVWFSWIILSLILIINVSATQSSGKYVNYVLYDEFNGTSRADWAVVTDGGNAWVNKQSDGVTSAKDGVGYIAGVGGWREEKISRLIKTTNAYTVKWENMKVIVDGTNGNVKISADESSQGATMQFKAGSFISSVSGTGDVDTGLDYATGVYFNVTMQFDNTVDKLNTTIEQNGVIYRVLNDTATASMNPEWVMVAAYDGLNISLRKVKVWNGTGADPGLYEPNPTITLDAPADANTTNKDVNFTFTVATVNTDSCTLYGNWSGVFAANRTLSGTSAGSYDFGKIGVGNVDGNYVWNVKCLVGATEYWAANRTLNIDLAFPSITVNPSNEWKSTNYSNNNFYDDTLVINFTFTDERDLYDYNITITKGGVKYYNNYSLMTGLTKTYANSSTITSWPAGFYDIKVSVSDSHTAKAIGDYKVTKGNKLVYETVEGNKITIECDDIINADTTKKVDRYNFKLTFLDGLTKSRTCHVKSDNEITYRPESEYKGHFVIKNGDAGNWLDWEGYGTPTIIKQNNKHYTVVFDSLPPVATFNSVGALNTYSAYYRWYRGVIQSTKSTDLVGELSDFTFNLSKDVTVSNIAAELVYNGTNYNGNTKSTASGYIKFDDTANNYVSVATVAYQWLYNITQADSSVIQATYSTSHATQDWLMDNCSNSNAKAVVFTVMKEEYPSQFIDTMDLGEIFADYWVVSKSNSRNFTGKYPGAAGKNMTVCISNFTSTLYADIYVKYTATGGFTHRYYLYNYTLTNSSMKTEYIYNFNTTTGISILNIIARAFDTYDFYSNIVVSLQRYYPSENLWRTVQMDKSGDFGLITFNILERSTDYRLIFKDTSNNILSQTTSLKFACTSGVCEQTKLLSPYESAAATTSLLISATYNNQTGYVTVVWSNPLGTNIELTSTVTSETGKGVTTICINDTKSAASGTFLCKVSGYSGTVFVRVNSTRSSVPYIDYGQYLSIATTRISHYISQKEGAFWSFLIIAPIVCFSLYSPVAVVIAGAMGLIIVNFLGILSAINITFIIIAIIISVVIALKLET